jgi:hypothetical protein
MSVYIYKGDEVSLIEPEMLHSALTSGWSVTKDAPKPIVKRKKKTVEIITDGNEGTDNK